MRYGDASMCQAADQALCKIEVSLPEHLRLHVARASESHNSALRRAA
jgi:hypothetical protein